MNNLYHNNKDILDKYLKIIWDYMVLSQNIEKCDVIFGCGCHSLDIPKRCVELYKQGYAPKILFAGGLGKITKDDFEKSEAEIYKDVAIKDGVNESDILIETNSTNTGDNFRFGLKVLEENNIKCNKILVVHEPLNERRTYSSAKSLLKGKELFITSPTMTFEEYLLTFDNKDDQYVINEISTIVGNIQRMIIYPQFGWQIENEVPDNVLDAYFKLKELGYTKFILSKEHIQELINKYGLADGQKEIYFN